MIKLRSIIEISIPKIFIALFMISPLVVFYCTMKQNNFLDNIKSLEALLLGCEEITFNWACNQVKLIVL